MIRTVRITNFRSIADSNVIELGNLTILIGANNSGKSAFLRALYAMQIGNNYTSEDNRLRGGNFKLEVSFSPPIPFTLEKQLGDAKILERSDTFFTVSGTPEGQLRANVLWHNGQTQISSVLKSTSPDHLVVPIFARRKPDFYETTLNEDNARNVSRSDRFLSSRLSNLNANFPEGIKFKNLVDQVFPDLKINTHLFGSGHRAGTSITSTSAISLDRMGEGVSGVVGLLMDFALSGERLYLIEEIENDLHPEALGKIINLILEEVSNGSQFVVSTHSDFVLRHLGAQTGAKVYRTKMEYVDLIPTTSFQEVSDAFDRHEVLSELGYLETHPNACFLFEEASAESFISKGLIPLFYPNLKALKTISSKGVGNLGPYYKTLYRTALFIHLDQRHPQAYVLADGDADGKAAIENLRRDFADSANLTFRNLTKSGIEDYYPPDFDEKISCLPDRSDSYNRAKAKGALASEVVDWIKSDPDNAKAKLRESASEIINWLAEVENAVRDLW